MPKETILRTERISHDGHENQVVVGWGRGLATVQIGVQEPGAIPGEREGGHFASINAAQVDQIITSLKRAKRQAFSA